MRILTTTLFVALLAFLVGPAVAQTGGGGSQGGPPPTKGGGPGGTYRGPGDTVPNGGSGGGGPGGIGGPPRGAPNTGSPSGGYAPGANPLDPPPFLPGGYGDPTSGRNEPLEPGSRPRTDSPTSWQVWWHFNRWSHLEASAAREHATTGSTGFYLGRGEQPQLQPKLRAGRSELRTLVRPALVDALRGDAGIDLSVSAAVALAKLRGVPAEDEETTFERLLEPLLADPSQTISEKAILAYGIHGEAAHFPDLAAILLDETRGRELLKRQKLGARHRVFAAAALGLLGEHDTDSGLRGRIQTVLARIVRDRGERPELQAAALLAMGHVPLAVDGPIGLSDDPSRGTQTRIDQVLTVLAFFEHESSDLLPRSQAPRTLTRLVEGTPESLRQRVILSLLTAIGTHASEPNEVVGACVQALGQITTAGSEPIDAAVRRELERLAFRSSEDRLVRSFAVLALARASVRSGGGEEPMLGLAETRRRLLQRLPRSRGNALAWTILALGLLEEDADARGEAPAAEVAAALRATLKDNRSEEIAGAAAIALGLVRDIEAEELLIETLEESGHERVRGYAALGLGLIGQPSSVPALRAFVERSAMQPFALEQGSIALALLGDQAVGPTLITILNEGANPLVQASIASAMGWIRDPRALTLLAERVGDPELGDAARAWSAVALGRIADEDERPWVARLSTDVQYDVAFPELTDPEFQEGLLDVP